jgi:hypothetical protein
VRNELRERINRSVPAKCHTDNPLRILRGLYEVSVSPESNWVQTNPSEGWFVLFRFYGPERGFYDRSWKLPDFDKIK